jgi:hypothetical protein
MDPDLVRQQEEAEREAMRLAGGKRGTPAPLSVAALHRTAASAELNPSPDAALTPYRTQQAGAQAEMQSSAPGLEAAGRAAPHLQPQARRGTTHSALWYFGQFSSFGIAGGMLGGGLGIAAANYIQLSAETAKLVIFGPAGFFALVCALASLFTGKPAQPRASSGT